tara:strand:- start:61 stop:264 length:204 start_codon:yes stop_codon:yes gene_type:complete
MNLNTIEKTLLVDLIKLELKSTRGQYWLGDYKKTLLKLKNKFKLAESEAIEYDKLYSNGIKSTDKRL